MTCGFRNAAGTDLESLFYSEYASPGALGFRKSNGYDLGNQFTNKTTLGYSVGYKNHTGTDMGFLRGDVDPETMFGVYKPAGWPWDVGITGHRDDNNIEWWKNWVTQQLNSGLTGLTKVDGVINDCIARDIDSDYDHGLAIFVYNSLKDVEVSMTAERLYHDASRVTDHIEKYDFEVSPYCRGFYFFPRIGAGKGCIDVYRFTANLGHWGTKVYEVCFGGNNDDNHDTYGTEASVRSYTCNGKQYVFYRG